MHYCKKARTLRSKVSAVNGTADATLALRAAAKPGEPGVFMVEIRGRNTPRACLE